MYKLVEGKDDMMMNFYLIQEHIGEGTFGNVYRAIRKSDSVQCAIKSVDKSTLGGDEISNLEVEIEILSQVDHINIIRTFEIYDEPKYLHIVMELMEGGELFSHIVEKEYYSEKEAADTMRPVADSIRYCHEMGVVHRDLKPENLLYSQKVGGILKVTDFGLARFYDDELMTTACGTPAYIAPEILEGNGYGLNVDCWSFGVILYVMLCGFLPFDEENTSVLFEKIKRGEYEFLSPDWDTMSDMSKDLISRCLRVNPEERISPAEIYHHEWFTSPKTPREPLPTVPNSLRRLCSQRKLKAAGTAAVAAARFARIGKNAQLNRLINNPQ